MMTSTSLLLLVLFACIETVFVSSCRVGKTAVKRQLSGSAAARLFPAGLSLQGSSEIISYKRLTGNYERPQPPRAYKAQGNLAKINAPTWTYAPG